ncbi:MAG: MBL fold metallo-hydrolase [Eubacterium sp.]|nr:MBL fold metallo-hydrolase [Eubacterium sp.]
MKIINLVENTEGNMACSVEHGLSFYIETEKHKILMDTGASDLFLKNAEKLGIDLTQVDIVILSHGHYDHGGGLRTFLEMNSSAKIYLQKSAFEKYYSCKEETGEMRYIGIDRKLKGHPQIVELDGNWKIDDEIYLFSGIQSNYPIPETNNRLKKESNSEIVQDDFLHEQCLVLQDGKNHILFSGCAHHGILNIMETYMKLFGREPDVAISGFHFMRKHRYSRSDVRAIIDTAKELIRYQTQFYTCHCTGEKPYEVMKKIMGYQIKYIHCGEELYLSNKKNKANNILWKGLLAGIGTVGVMALIAKEYKKK